MDKLHFKNRLNKLGMILLLVLLSACAISGPPHNVSQNGALGHSSTNVTAYVVNDQKNDFSRFAPVFIAEQTEKMFNRIGKPRARIDDKGNEQIDVAPNHPFVYVDRQTFATTNGNYTNLIYRIHFEKTPFSLFPFHITAGNNNGLLTVVTLNAKNRPVLITTVHTCGCFLAIVPTSYLPDSAYPQDWNSDSQWIYGMTLPAQLALPTPFDDENRIVIYLKNETHRVMDIGLLTQTEIKQRYQSETLNIASIDDLMKLPIGDETTSFFETNGSRKGYVKGSHKPLERLLVSWWSLDWRVGEDKAFGNKDETGTVFYTSLKPWNRQASDMWPFADFLAFWGWGL